ncbi:MAG: hypothetical protein DRI54_00855 [Bacteroidetes bacterium]|nr:MAG: hypothetical protein DRI54_00855 [Bacteroidota bacterium]
MITISNIKAELKKELAEASSEMESNMITAEYNLRIKKLKLEGEEAYKQAYVLPYDAEDDCGCGN